MCVITILEFLVELVLVLMCVIKILEFLVELVLVLMCGIGQPFPRMASH